MLLEPRERVQTNEAKQDEAKQDEAKQDEAGSPSPSSCGFEIHTQSTACKIVFLFSAPKALVEFIQKVSTNRLKLDDGSGGITFCLIVGGFYYSPLCHTLICYTKFSTGHLCP